MKFTYSLMDAQVIDPLENIEDKMRLESSWATP
jgi:hypothetical protein